jgi:hypothetical protein
VILSFNPSNGKGKIYSVNGAEKKLEDMPFNIQNCAKVVTCGGAWKN